MARDVTAAENSNARELMNNNNNNKNSNNFKKNFIKKSVSQYRNNKNNNNKITSAGAKALNLHNSHNNLTQCHKLSIKTNRIIKKKNKALLKSNLYKRSTLIAAKSQVKM